MSGFGGNPFSGRKNPTDEFSHPPPGNYNKYRAFPKVHFSKSLNFVKNLLEVSFKKHQLRKMKKILKKH